MKPAIIEEDNFGDFDDFDDFDEPSKASESLSSKEREKRRLQIRRKIDEALEAIEIKKIMKDDL